MGKTDRGHPAHPVVLYPRDHLELPLAGTFDSLAAGAHFEPFEVLARYDIHNARNGIGSVYRRGAVEQRFHTIDRDYRH